MKNEKPPIFNLGIDPNIKSIEWKGDKGEIRFKNERETEVIGNFTMYKYLKERMSNTL
jgi:hypothetical protein